MPNLDRDYYLDKQGLQTLVNELEKNIVAEEFSSSATYNLGDYCIYGNLLYICTTPITTAGSWTGSTNWLQVLLADEVAEKTEIQTITLAQWEALTPDQKASGDYVISDATLSPLSASLIPYDNTTSGLTADDVQEAIDELAQGGGSGGHTIENDAGTTLTQRANLQFKGAYSVDNSSTSTTEVNVVRSMTTAEYNQLSAAEKVGIINITDADYNLSELSDTSISSPTEGQVLAVNSSGDWTNKTLTASDILTTQTVTVTLNTVIVDSSSVVSCYQYGKVVCLFIRTLSPTSEVAYESTLISGLPKAVCGTENRFSIVDRATNKAYRLMIDNNGNLKEWYNSNGKIPSGADLYATIVYIAE